MQERHRGQYAEGANPPEATLQMRYDDLVEPIQQSPYEAFSWIGPRYPELQETRGEDVRPGEQLKSSDRRRRDGAGPLWGGSLSIRLFQAEHSASHCFSRTPSTPCCSRATMRHSCRSVSAGRKNSQYSIARRSNPTHGRASPTEFSAQ